MPIDAEIPLQVKPVDIQPPNAMQMYGNALALQHGIQQQQMTAQQIQGATMENQQRSRDLQFRQALATALMGQQAGSASTPAAAPPQSSPVAPDPDSPTATPPMSSNALAPPVPNSTPVPAQDATAPGTPPSAQASTSPSPLSTASGRVSRGILGPIVDRHAVMNDLTQQGFGPEAMKWGMDYAAMQGTLNKQAADQLKLATDQYETIGRLAGAVIGTSKTGTLAQTMEAYRNAHAQAQAMGLNVSDEPDTLPTKMVGGETVPDLTGVTAHYQRAMAVKDQAEYAQKLLDTQREILNSSAKNVRDWAGIFGVAKDQSTLEALVNEAKSRGASPSDLAIVPHDPQGRPVYSPEAMANLRNVAETPEQRALDAKLPAELSKANADANISVRADVSSQLTTAAGKGSSAYATALSNLRGDKDPRVAAMASQMPDAPAANQWNPSFVKQIETAGLTAEQRIHEQDLAQQRQILDGMRETAIDNQQTWRNFQMGFKTTQQQQKQLRQLDQDDHGNGTASNPGLNTTRTNLAEVLASGKIPGRNGAADTPLTPEMRQDYVQRYNAATNKLQSNQFQRAEIGGIERPDASAVLGAKENETLTASDGSTWKKSGGVLWFQGEAGSTPATPGTSAKGGAQTDPIVTVKGPDGTPVTGPKSGVDAYFKSKGWNQQ